MQIKIKLDQNEKYELEYYTFSFNGIQIQFEQCMKRIYEYDDEMFEKLTNTLIKKYTDLQKCQYNILKNHGYEKAKIISHNFYMNDGVFEVNVR